LKSIGVFGHSNESVGALSTILADGAIDHVLVGISESHAEALEAMVRLCAFGAGSASQSEARAGLATFLTACTRGDDAPELARQLIGDGDLDQTFEGRLERLEGDLLDARTRGMEPLARRATHAWAALKIRKGARAWRVAAPLFLGIARPTLGNAVTPDAVAKLRSLVEKRRPRALVEMDMVHRSPVQLMNFYQTKGREADAVVLVYGSTDWFGKEGEPFTKASRVLFVSLTRARERVVVILPPAPHRLVAPFAALV
jgi:DNA helicase-2/ATP-dependent DNA helicase PcrA